MHATGYLFERLRQPRLDDAAVGLGMVLELVRAAQHLALERPDSDEHLEAPGAREKLDEILLVGDLGIALDEEGR